MKLYASELLSVLLQQSAANQAYAGEVDGILALLTASSQYKRREPVDLEEAELVEGGHFLIVEGFCGGVC